MLCDVVVNWEVMMSVDVLTPLGALGDAGNIIMF